MKLLYDYELLVNEVFYRSEHILSYLERHPKLSSLDKEAISNTILDALVYKGLLDPSKESLDLDNMCIKNDTNHYTYNPTPNITSIPLSIKEAMRTKCITISGSIPISVFYAKPAGLVSFCIYDMNTALSSLFPSFSFITCSYNSPTRPNERAEHRPFLEVEINNELYLVDALTKRIFKSSWFKETYDFTVESIRDSKSFDKEQQEWYNDAIKYSDSYGSFLSITQPLYECMKGSPRQKETLYEVECSKKHFPDAFDTCDKIIEQMNNCNIVDLIHEKSFTKLFAPKEK